MIEQFYHAVAMVFDPYALLVLAGGVLLGIIFGAIPGLTATMGVAILIPITFVMDASVGLVMLVGIYCGGIYGGAISAILVSIPGTPSGMMTTLDGYPMGQRGEAGKAIGIATYSSFIGGIVSAIVLILAAPQLAKMALSFGAAEYFMIAVFGLSIIASISSESIVKGLISGVLGMMMTIVGMDYVTSTPRFTFGVISLLSGFAFIPMMIGLFGMREFLTQVALRRYNFKVEQNVKNILPTWKEFKNLLPTNIRGGFLGSLIGALPGAGGPIASFLSYDFARRLSKKAENYGKGEPEGVAASESANNGVTGGALIPMLTLGVPGDGVTAVMLGAFMVHNLRPGPSLFVNHGDLVFAIYIGLILSCFFLLGFGMIGARFFAKILTLPMPVLLPFISVLTIVGAFAIRNSIFDIWVMLGFGVFGYILYMFKFPPMPMILGIVLGPIAESNLRRALLVSEGSWLIFIQRPISLVLLFLTILLVAYPYVTGVHKRKSELEKASKSK
ncbi:tripartite tricarboxylate transporter permease [Desulfitibacter alkalitolerans]|uniref:tripartite tricarboxylate transporter permease n=1 Tax=Desulfitibacter alkalitolerans TaxID=264641 RepID=UPI00048223AF|nr:tripartite tricarboxylate transporter permease [Desulfitibacter alkalitolerans]